jgi:lipoyl(octanoyl) transferase
MSIEIKLSKKRIPYKKAMLFLNNRVEQVKNGDNRELIWILEHPKTYTAGVSFKLTEIIDKKIKIIKTNRGGKITLHNPGQKIIYFVINLNNRKKDIRKLINCVETSIIEFLKIFKINAKKDKKNIGIWVEKKKIAAIGLRVSRWVAFHGFSINISNNLKEYHKIMPCGLDSTKITSVFSEKNTIPKSFEKKLINILVKNINRI